MPSAQPATEAGDATSIRSTSARPTDAEPEWGARQFPRRPDKLKGRTREVATPLGDAYVTVNHHDGQPVEVIVNLGKAGTSERALTEAIGRLCSTALQHGTPLTELCRQLRGISSEDAFGFGDNKILSVPDAVAQALAEEIQDD